MSPFHSSYLDCVPEEDFVLTKYLSWQVLPVARRLASSYSDIQRKFKTSASWCHLAARAVATVFADLGVTYADGYVIDVIFVDGQPTLHGTVHSWCKTKHESILDVSPVGILTFSPLLLAKSSGVRDTSNGYVNGRYVETNAVKTEVREAMQKHKIRESLPPYISILKRARKEVDSVAPNITLKGIMEGNLD